MDREIKLQLLQKQIEVYSVLAEKLENCKSVIELFDNKIMNVKIDKAFKEINVEICFTTSHNIQVSSWNNRDIQTARGTYYVDYYTTSVKAICKEENEKRLDSIKTIESIDKEIFRINNRISELEKSIKDYDQMLKDYEKIADQIRKFKVDYDYSIREKLDFSRIY